ncbi:hypothetical protein AB0N92_04125 [Streptomyces sp. NPDC093248]|uniref:DUF6907 domain-containing protein n=1 Tax=Streptomyces sp. NPDC093248 TaxID=3155072 RepID=UPI003418566D
MSTEPRTTTVGVFVTKPLEIDEPDWCKGHDEDLAQYKVDVSHEGPTHTIAPGGREVFRAFLTQAPFSTVDRTVGLYVEPYLTPRTCTPAEVDQLAADLIEAAGQLRSLGRELAALLEGGDQ